MKKTGFNLLLLIYIFSLGGCSPSDDGKYVTPITIYEKINGLWGLSSLTYIDEYAKVNKIEPSEQNLSNWFNYGDFQLQLNVDENNNPLDYLVKGDVPELFPCCGFWDLNSAYPSTNMKPLIINLYSDQDKSVLTSQLYLSSIPGTTPNMEVRLVRTSNQVPYSTYVFKLFPVN